VSGRRLPFVVVATLVVGGLLLGVLWYAGMDPASSRNRLVVTELTTGVTTTWRSDPEHDLWAPAWSPDGTRIAWHQTASEDGPADLMVANADGTDPIRIAGGSHATWSPDARHLAFESQHDEPGNWDIYVVDVDGTGLRRLTDDPAFDWAPEWSPDGRSIMFDSDRTGKEQVYVIDVEGVGDPRAVTTVPGRSVHGEWSPDGSRIAFGSDRTGDAEIYVADADGSNVVALTDNDAGDWDPVWSPDGSRLVFMSFRDDNAELYAMNVDGSGQTNLTRDPSTAESGGFEWSPDGSRIIHAVGPPSDD
jgi:Tol biopolymer transport system component